MKIFNGETRRSHFWCIISIVFLFYLFLVYFESFTLTRSKNVQHYSHSFSSLSPVTNSLLMDKKRAKSIVEKYVFDKAVEPMSQISAGENQNSAKEFDSNNGDSCSGQYIYVHNLPRKFNEDLLRECERRSKERCPDMSNEGFGPKLKDHKRVLTPKGWFATDHFALEVIFHNRMKHYKCLTKNSSLASAIYVPFYSGRDIIRYLSGFNVSMRDRTSHSLAKWVSSRPEWKVMGGRDHFTVTGRITWEFRRQTNKESDFGNNFFLLPESRNMTLVGIESNPWDSKEFAVPYPSYFHPSSDNEVFEWQNRMRRQVKKNLFCFAGAPRPTQVQSIRNQIIGQCQSSKGKCKLLDCGKSNLHRCYSPVNIMELFQNSVFCIQPPGDTPTRRSAFDSILAGCIPVYFHPASAYIQYIFHLPQNYSKYSVYIPEDDIRSGKVKIHSVLDQISHEDVKAMREEVIKLIPKLMYAHPTARMKTTEDAFDIAIKRVIERVDEAREEVKNERGSDSVPLENSWKYKLWGRVKEHEWDHFFGLSKPNDP